MSDNVISHLTGTTESGKRNGWKGESSYGCRKLAWTVVHTWRAVVRSIQTRAAATLNARSLTVSNHIRRTISHSDELVDHWFGTEVAFLPARWFNRQHSSLPLWMPPAFAVYRGRRVIESSWVAYPPIYSNYADSRNSVPIVTLDFDLLNVFWSLQVYSL